MSSRSKVFFDKFERLLEFEFTEDALEIKLLCVPGLGVCTEKIAGNVPIIKPSGNLLEANFRPIKYE
jgi:hypothetical protein